MQEIARQELPRSMAPDWTELAYMQLNQGSTATLVFLLAVVFVFLVLAAQYESWKLPLAVILVMPMCLLCSLVGVQLAGMDVSLFTQIGFVVLVGLASKNAILIVEFAKQSQEAGVPRREATLEACKLRLRPILMTSFAFIFGVVPLVLAEGAGARCAGRWVRPCSPACSASPCSGSSSRPFSTTSSNGSANRSRNQLIPKRMSHSPNHRWTYRWWKHNSAFEVRPCADTGCGLLYNW